MMSLFDQDVLWRNALVVIPLALAVAVLCRTMRLRPATRHSMWLVVLLFLVAPGVMPRAVESAGPALVDLVESAMPPARDSVESELAEISVSDSASDAPVLVDADPVLNEPTFTMPRSALSRAMDVAPIIETPTLAQPAETTKQLDRYPTRWNVLDAITTETRESRLAESPLAVTPDSPEIDAASEMRPETEVALVEVTPSRKAPFKASPEPPVGAAILRDAVEISPPLLELWRAQTVAYTAQWMAFGRDVRDAVVAAPGIPPLVWAAGALVAALVCSTRLLRFYVLMRRAENANPSTVAHVREAARSIGLRRTPTVLVTDARVPPMVWCGRRARLVLPRHLWTDLDRDGRTAVLLHELAHIRRRDNIVCWLEMLVGCLFWWHPVVWWVRRRLREEADLCCDVWVTSLAPKSRRAYAQALLQTRTYINDSRIPAPVLGLGVTSVRTRRFARRLTMVMTDHARPRLSFRGLASTAALIAAGMMVSPALACNEDKAKKACAPEPPAAQEAPEPDISTFEQHMRDRAAPRPVGHDESDDLEDRVSRLEDRLDRMAEALEKLVATRGGGQSSHDQKRAEREYKRELERAKQAQKREMERVQREVERARREHERARRAQAQGQHGNHQGSHDSAGETFARKYKMSAGKLKSLTALMSRDDVPILIEPGEGYITVHANGSQHMVFKAFVTMINQEDTRKGYKLSKGKLKGLTSLMVRDDVPILVSPRDDQLVVHGTDLEQLIFSAFVEMIAPGDGDHSSTEAAARKRYEKEKHRHEGKAHKKHKKSADHDHHAKMRDQQMMHLERKMADIERSMEEIEIQAELMMEQAEALMEQAEVFEEEAEALAEEAEALAGVDRDHLMERAEELYAQAQLLEQEAEGVEAEADRFEDRMEELEELAEELEEAAEELEEEAEEDA